MATEGRPDLTGHELASCDLCGDGPGFDVLVFDVMRPGTMVGVLVLDAKWEHLIRSGAMRIARA